MTVVWWRRWLRTRPPSFELRRSPSGASRTQQAVAVHKQAPPLLVVLRREHLLQAAALHNMLPNRIPG